MLAVQLALAAALVSSMGTIGAAISYLVSEVAWAAGVLAWFTRELKRLTRTHESKA